MRNPGRFTHGALLSLALFLAQAPVALAQNRHVLPLVMPVGSEREGLVRITNTSDRHGTVTIHAIDDSGERFGPVTLPVGPKVTVQFFSMNLEHGGRGLSAGVGDGTGLWRLELETDLDIEPLAYVRTPDKFLTSVHDVVQGVSMRWEVPYFNSADAVDKQSLLRVINVSGADAEVQVEGYDDAGAPAPGGAVRFTLPAGEARLLSAQMLETGDSAFEGALGDGLAKWHLTVSADQPLVVMGLLSLNRTGHLANLSTSTIGRDRGSAGFAPADEAAFDALFVGKAIVGTESSMEVSYHRYLGGNRFTDSDPENGETESGTYTYRGTGPNTGIIDVTYDHGARCSASLVFSSATAGTASNTCEGGYSASGSWKAVWSPPIVNFAPVDQATFDALVIGRVADLEEGHTARFFRDNRFIYSDPLLGLVEGGYTYERAASDAGTLDISLDIGIGCSFGMNFLTATGGTFTTDCITSGDASGRWRLR